MGLKENFSQAVKELTGNTKEDDRKRNTQYAGLKKALDNDQPSVSDDSFTEGTSRPYYRNQEQGAQNADGRDGYNNQGYSDRRDSRDNYNQGYNDRRDSRDYNNQGYDDRRDSRDYNNQGYNDRRDSRDNYNNQGYSDQRDGRDYNNQGYDDRRGSRDNYNNQGYNDQRDNRDNYNNQGYNNQRDSRDNYNNQGYNDQRDSRDNYNNQGYSNQRDNRDNYNGQAADRSYGGTPRSDRGNSYTAPQQSRDYSSNQSYGRGGNTYPLGSQPAAQRRNYSDSADTEITIISRNTMIDGNVRSLADMSIDGSVKGDVETTKDVELNGRIVGNMTCNNANMFASQVQGNVVLKGSVDIGRDTLLIGDLNSGYACINGKVKGNVDVSGKAEFRADAVIFGDISASTITVDDGAIIQGYVSTTFLNKDESEKIFPESIEISME